MEDFTQAFIEALIWSSGEEFDGKDAADLAPELRERITRECAAFYTSHSDLFLDDNYKGRSSASVVELAGHDFALTRNGHGAGFWDGDWQEPAATTLDKASKAAGELSLYVGDDGLVYGYLYA